MRASLGILAALAAFSCNHSDGYEDPRPEPQIVSVLGPPGGAVACNPTTDGGVCPLAIDVMFRLPPDEFVTKAVVRFQGDGGDVGVDHEYLLPYTHGSADGSAVAVKIDAAVPPTILRRGALFTYTVRLITGAGERSAASTLTVSVT